ncbi:hypothetical protein CLU97_0051 [Chryseobacterium sp. 7]|uniref:hypothetical protein n=1 Tax=Chryseobacterium sp. 7 TaxID=2035214 RepID=UPI000F1D3949|nr:hypothetical protein [Chryseobacterium sp. 7]RLJ30677.1 hypothetical protein CLU97_0051 [Chryseobacterium sp. 7]
MSRKSLILTDQIFQKMKIPPLDPKEFPKLSTWSPEYLDKVLENLSRKANPSKTEITIQDKQWAATMLEMEMQTQSATIREEDMQEDSQLVHNKMMFEKMKKENITSPDY